jgi:hypothetical protein
MAESWVNTKGKKFVGQTAAVPAPDEKSAVVVDYEDLKKLNFVAALNGAAPSEASNSAPQAVNVSVMMSLDGVNAYANWDYEFTAKCVVGGVELTFDNVAVIPGGFSFDAVFPAGVLAGQVGIVEVISGHKNGRVNIVVTA